MQQSYQQEEDSELKIRKAIGREHLYANRIEDALAVFAGILRDKPEDVESLVILGDLYLASGDSSTAVQLYSRAKQQQKEDGNIEQRLQLAQVETEVTQQTIAESVPTHPQAVARLLQRLTGRTNPISESEINRSADLLEMILKSSNPSKMVSEHLNEIDSLLPALIELNIRQARADGRYDLADGLKNLQANVQMQLQAPPEIPRISAHTYSEESITDEDQIEKSVLILAATSEQNSRRIALIVEGLRISGMKASISTRLNSQNLPDIIIASNPHPFPQIMSSLAAAAAAMIPIIVDLTTDFEQMPIDHPNYTTHGLGTPANARAYTSALLLASLITVPNQTIATVLKNNNHNVQTIPDGWSSLNLLWQSQTYQHKGIHLGWIGKPGHYEDVALIRRIIVRVLREFSETQLIIAGDQRVYHLFESIPGNRRRYIPLPPHEEYPQMLDQIDILMQPYRNTPFNYSRSDRTIMEACIKGIPWIASPIPSTLQWGAGGLVAYTPEEWHVYLKKLIADKNLRQSLGEEGIQHAQTREINLLRKAWLEAIRTAETAIKENQPNSKKELK